MASGNYSLLNGKKLELGNKITIEARVPNVAICYAGVKRDVDLFNSGGRVLGVTGVSLDLSRARAIAYEQINYINFKSSLCLYCM